MEILRNLLAAFGLSVLAILIGAGAHRPDVTDHQNSLSPWEIGLRLFFRPYYQRFLRLFRYISRSAAW